MPYPFSRIINRGRPGSLHASLGLFLLLALGGEAQAQAPDQPTFRKGFFGLEVVHNGPVHEGGLASFRVSTKHGRGMTYSFDWDNDNIFDLVDHGETTAEHRFPDDGTYSVRVLAKDANRRGQIVTTTIQVLNVSPQAVGHNSGPVFEDEPVDIFAVVKDPGKDTFSYSFDLNSDGEYEIKNQSSNKITHKFAKAGTHVVNIMVRDDDGGMGTAVTVVEVRTGVMEVDAGQDIRTKEGDIISFSAKASEEAALPVTYSWNFGDNTSEVQGVLVRHSYTEPGGYTATVTATDAKGKVGRDKIIVQIENVNPQLLLTNDGPKEANQAVRLIAVPLDPGRQANFRYSFDLDADGTYDIVDQPSPDVLKIWSSPGEYPVSARIKDGNGGVAKAETTVRVIRTTRSEFFLGAGAGSGFFAAKVDAGVPGAKVVGYQSGRVPAFMDFELGIEATGWMAVTVRQVLTLEEGTEYAVNPAFLFYADLGPITTYARVGMAIHVHPNLMGLDLGFGAVWRFVDFLGLRVEMLAEPLFFGADMGGGFLLPLNLSAGLMAFL